ncbi:MAG: bifunctional diguanylate cyclase/phosphodiesterase [Treponema sp.]
MQPSIIQCRKANEILSRSELFDEELSRFIDTYHKTKTGAHFILMLIDIDNLQYINDLSGRKTGSRIVNTAESLLSHRKSDVFHVYRLEGKIFAVIVENSSGGSFISSLCEDIFIEFSRKRISISIGIAVYPEHGKSASTLYRDADLALRYIKINFKGNYCIYKPEMYTHFFNEIYIQKRMSDGLTNKEFLLYYQPQFYIKNHRLRGFEALLRWNNNVTGLQYPGTFIPAAEKSDFINRIGDWVLEKAMTDLHDLEAKYNFKGIVSVNVSRRQLLSPLFLTHFKYLLGKAFINPAKLEIEITESSFMDDPARTALTITELKKNGVRISIDDFGTGYSSLCNLSTIPVDTVKIDKSFIDAILDKNDINDEIIKAVTIVSGKTGLETIAEGVETEQQVDFLINVSCNCIQGFIWGKPVPLTDCIKYL